MADLAQIDQWATRQRIVCRDAGEEALRRESNCGDFRLRRKRSDAHNIQLTGKQPINERVGRAGRELDPHVRPMRQNVSHEIGDDAQAQ